MIPVSCGASARLCHFFHRLPMPPWPALSYDQSDQIVMIFIPGTACCTYVPDSIQEYNEINRALIMSKYTYILSLQILKTACIESPDNTFTNPQPSLYNKTNKMPCIPKTQQGQRFHEYKIALLLKEHYRKYVEQWEKFMPADTRLTFLPYKTLDEMKDIFLTVKEDYDGFYMWVELSRIMQSRPLVKWAEMRWSVIHHRHREYIQILIQKMVSVKPAVIQSWYGFLKSEENLEELTWWPVRRCGSYLRGPLGEQESISQINKEEADINKFIWNSVRRISLILLSHILQRGRVPEKFWCGMLLCISKRPGFCQIIDLNQE